jgi:hypothetical protein
MTAIMINKVLLVHIFLLFSLLL